MVTLSIINQKGGCGKTTTAINLSGALSHLDRRTLLIDLDPQGHASLGLNLGTEETNRGMTEVLTEQERLEAVICRSKNPNLHVAPADISLSTVEHRLADATHKEMMLVDAIQNVQGTYDYVIIDSPPSLGILTFNALRASHWAIVPIDVGFFALHGLSKLKEIVDLLEGHTGHQVQLRALVTMANLRTRFAREVIGEIGRNFEGAVFRTVIRNNVRLREASSDGIPIVDYDPRSHGALDYLALAAEVIAMEAQAQAELPEWSAVEQGRSAWGPDRPTGIDHSHGEGTQREGYFSKQKAFR